MKITSYISDHQSRPALVCGSTIVDAAHLLGREQISMTELLSGNLYRLKECYDRRGTEASGGRLLEDVTLDAPIPAPKKFLGIGLNYKSHVQELIENGHLEAKPKHQMWFNKQTSCIAGPRSDIHLPHGSNQLDYEGELAVVIGQRCRNLSKSDARRAIAGYMVCNDVSVRDWQAQSPTITMGKSYDTHGPTGPWMTTADEIESIDDLRLRTWVNNELRQDAPCSDMVFTIDEMISELSHRFTLEPGDILATGTPSGVGATHQPPAWLRVGDMVRVQIDGLGTIENRVVQEP